MIRTFVHKGLKELYNTGRTARINSDHHAKCLILLDALNHIEAPTDMNIMGWHFHSIGGKPLVYSVRVNGNFRITFEFKDGDVFQTWYGNYH